MSSTSPIVFKEPKAQAAVFAHSGGSHRFLSRVFSFPTMLASLLAVLAVVTVRSRFDDPDLWWHVKVGEIIAHTHSVPLTDLFSYTTNHHAWIPHEWLAQLTIFFAYQAGGYSGLMLWLCLASSAIVISGYLLCTLYSRNVRVAFIGALIVYFFATVGFSIRPQMIGYLLLIVELAVIHLGRTRNSRWFLLLPPLFAVWVNCHGSFFLGLLIGSAYLASSFFSFKLGSLTQQRWAPEIRSTFALALGLSMAALFVNPVGVSQILYPLDAMLHQPVNLASITEWHPLVMTSIRGIGVISVLALIALPLLLRCGELCLDELLLLLLGTWLAVSHERMLFVFGILGAPILTRLIGPWWDDAFSRQDRWWPNLALIGVSAAIIVGIFPTHQDLENQVAEGSPVKAVDYIQAHHLSGPMLNDYVFGGYLIWAAPERPVFIDGRADIFEWTGVLGEMRNWATLQTDPNQLLNKYNIRYCLLSRESPMARVLPLLKGWQSVYSDNNAVVFVRNSPDFNERASAE